MQIEQNAEIPKYKHDKIQQNKIQIAKIQIAKIAKLLKYNHHIVDLPP